MTTERTYWRTSILHNRFFNHEKTQEFDSKPKSNQEDLQSSILHSARLKKNLEESRKAFFNMEQQNNIENKETVQSIVVPEIPSKKPSKKISFKIKKTASIYRKSGGNSRVNTISANSVAELTSRFNKLVTTKTVFEDPKLSKLVSRVNSQRRIKEELKENKVTTKIKNDEQIYFIRRPSIKRKSSVRKVTEYTTKLKPETGKVKATIEIFETITSRVSPTNENKDFPSISSIGKPKVPEKKFGPEVIDIVNKNKERSTKIILAKQRKDSKADSIMFNKLRKSEDNTYIGNSRADDNVKRDKKKVEEIRKGTNKLIDDVKIIIAQTLNIDNFEDDKTEIVQVVNIPIVTKRCDSKYETLNVSKVSPKLLERRNNSLNEESITEESPKDYEDTDKVLDRQPPKIPNKSFLWSRNMPEYPQIKLLEQLEELYDKVDPIQRVQTPTPTIPPRPNNLNLQPDFEEKIYEDIVKSDSYEYCSKYEELDDGYDYCEGSTMEDDNIYETLPTPKKDKAPTAPTLPPKKQQIPLPPRPPSRNASFYSQNTDEKMSNCYESIYNSSSKRFDLDSNYESIDECLRMDPQSVWGSVSNASSDEKSNSLYVYGKCQSDRSGSDRTDEWVDLSDNEENCNEVDSILVVREKPKVGKRNSGWSQKCREQRKKAGPSRLSEGDSDSDHIYESLCGTTPKEPVIPTAEEENDAYDSFDSDSESEYHIKKDIESNIDITNAKLPELPNNQTSVSTLAKTIKKNFTKSFHKMTKRKSEPDNLNAKPKSNLYQNITFASSKPETHSTDSQSDRDKTIKKGIFNKFRRSMTFVSDSFVSDSSATTTPTTELPAAINQRPKSTFYLTETIDLDDSNHTERNNRNYSPPTTRAKPTPPLRPPNPPPPTPHPPTPDHPPIKTPTQLYTECGLFKPDSNKRSSTNWYADVGLYQSDSPATTSSAENSGGTTASSACASDNASTKSSSLLFGVGRGSAECDDDDRTVVREEYYNMRNEGGCYNGGGSESDSKTEIGDGGGRSQRWLDEPLYQFYDAAILESEYKHSTQSFDYDGYEEVGKIRPSAMELISPIKNSIGAVSRTLWCEVPEVLQSAVLSSLSETQQKIQEAKFEMLTSEASYLHSLNVLVDHFVKNIKESELLTDKESELLFGNIFSVKECSEKLLADLERCWQENILLTNICDIVNTHAELNFHVYVTFCENQILLDSTLNKLKERLSFSRYLEQLERSTACHSLKLNSFLLLPMQRITRWRLLVDAVLKRLVTQDDEYLSSRNTMATLSKVAQQCNEGARKMERALEIQQISSRLEFSRGVPAIDIIDGHRWLVKSGPLIQMVAKTSDLKVTFGKRFTKVPLYLFLFNDILLITKTRNKDGYSVLHYCYRNFIEVNAEDSLESLPLKNAQGRHLIFLTILENHDEKLVELLLSCDSVSDKERWLEAILPPKSENPDEIIYEHWDCPQVTAVHNYTACQSDELSLTKGDVINVDKKLTDGWYHGEKIADSQIGWFPSNYTVEIANPHVRARNLKMRYRLLAFSMNYVLNNQ